MVVFFSGTTGKDDGPLSKPLMVSIFILDCIKGKKIPINIKHVIPNVIKILDLLFFFCVINPPVSISSAL